MARQFVAASSQYLETVTAPVTAAPLTIACWFNPTALALGELVTLETSAFTTQYHLLQATADGQMRAVSSNGTTTAVATSGVAYVAGQWQHAAGVFASATSRAAYLNGSYKGTDATNVTPTLSVSRMEVGRIFNSGGSPTQYFGGGIAHVAIWNVALSDFEVAQLAYGVLPTAIQPSALVFYAPLAGSASPEPDTIAGNNLTVSGATQTTDPTLSLTFSVGGTDRTALNSKYEWEVRDALNETANTASLVVRGFTPTVGQTVTIRKGAVTIFGGVAVRVAPVRRRAGTRIRYRLECTDYAYLLDRRLVNHAYTTWQANSIAVHLINSFTTGFTMANVQSGLTVIDLPNKMETLSQALTRAANLAGAFWYVDENKDLHFRTTENLVTPAALTAVNSCLKGSFTYERDLSQVRTRVYVEGGGSSVLIDVPVGMTNVPVSDASFFNAGSGSAITADAQILTYTGKDAGGAATTVGALSGTPAAPTVAVTAAGAVDAGTHVYTLTVVTAAGETTTGGTVSITTFVAKQITVTLPVSTDPYALSFNLYRSKASSPFGTLYLVTTGLDCRAGGTSVDSLADSALGGEAPTVNTGAQITGVPAGNLTLPLASASGFPSAGWARVGSQVISFASISGQTLSGIQASGTGSLLSAVRANEPVVALPVLTGIPASGAGSVTTTIPTGTALNLLVQRDNAGAQTTLAALEGGDGIHEHYLQDSRLSISGAQARGDAELTLGKDPDDRVEFTSEDPSVESGRTIIANFPDMGVTSLTLKLQQVRVSMRPGRSLPQRSATATNRLKDFFQYVRDLEDKASKRK